MEALRQQASIGLVVDEPGSDRLKEHFDRIGKTVREELANVQYNGDERLSLVRKDVERIDGRAGETFSGIRVVRAFRREMLELLDYMRGRHTVLRKEMFAQRRELVLWASWSLLLGAVNVVIVWYGGWLNIRGGASIGDIMAFQWYTFLLLNPVWQLVNSFSELQRSLAAMERVAIAEGSHDSQS